MGGLGRGVRECRNTGLLTEDSSTSDDLVRCRAMVQQSICPGRTQAGLPDPRPQGPLGGQRRWVPAACGGQVGVVLPGGNPWTDIRAASGHAWTAADQVDGPQDVARKAANPFGVFDMIGNVWEWCWDYADSARYGDYRSLRGGGWADREWSCRSSVRRGSARRTHRRWSSVESPLRGSAASICSQIPCSASPFLFCQSTSGSWNSSSGLRLASPSVPTYGRVVYIGYAVVPHKV